MKKIVLVIQLLCAAFSCNGETANLSILVNGNLIESGLSGFYLAIGGDSSNEKVAVDYIPGELLLGISGKELLDSKKYTKFELSLIIRLKKKVV